MSLAFQRVPTRRPQQQPAAVEPTASVPAQAATEPPSSRERYAAAGNQARASQVAEGQDGGTASAAPRPAGGACGATLARLQAAEATARAPALDPEHLGASAPLLEQVFLDAAAAVERHREAERADRNWLADLLGGQTAMQREFRAAFAAEFLGWHGLALDARQQASMLDAALTLAQQALAESDVTRAFLEADGCATRGEGGFALDGARLEADLGVVADGFARRNLAYAGASFDRQVEEGVLGANARLDLEAQDLGAALARVRAEAQDARAGATAEDLARIEEVVAFADNAGSVVDLVGSAAAGYRAVLGTGSADGDLLETVDPGDMISAGSSLGLVVTLGYAEEIQRLRGQLADLLAGRDGLLELASARDLEASLARYAEATRAFEAARDGALAGASSEIGDLCNLAAGMDDFDRLSGRLGADRERAVPAMLHLARVRAAHRALGTVAGPLGQRVQGLAGFEERLAAFCGQRCVVGALHDLKADVRARACDGGFLAALREGAAATLAEVELRRGELDGIAVRFDAVLASRTLGRGPG